MKAELTELLRRIWKERASIPSQPIQAADHIYTTFYAVTSGVKVPRDYAERIEAIHRQRHRGSLVRQWMTVTEGKEGKETKRKAVAFYHFNPREWVSGGASGERIRWRLYLNPKGPAEVLKVFEVVVNQFVDAPGSHALTRPIKAKVSGPDLLGRRDTVVVYTVDKSTVMRMARHFRSTDIGEFNRATPDMTAKTSKGIAIGAEPPAIAIFSDANQPQSFGNIRCEIMALALRETRSEHAFIARTAEYLKLVGIDPDHPERQSQKGNLEAAWRAARRARERRGVSPGKRK